MSAARPTKSSERRVFTPAAAIIVVFVVLTVSFPGTAEVVVDAAQRNVVAGFAWYSVLIVAIFLAFVLWVGMSRYGDIRLGADDEPEYSVVAWFAMLFAAGMGIALVFWGVYEPLSHFVDPKPGVTGETSVAGRATLPVPSLALLMTGPSWVGVIPRGPSEDPFSWPRNPMVDRGGSRR